LKELSEDIEEIRFSEGEIVLREKDLWDEDFACYFIISGKIELYLDAITPIFLTYLKENEAFGLPCFV